MQYNNYPRERKPAAPSPVIHKPASAEVRVKEASAPVYAAPLYSAPVPRIEDPDIDRVARLGYD